MEFWTNGKAIGRKRTFSLRSPFAEERILETLRQSGGVAVLFWEVPAQHRQVLVHSGHSALNLLKILQNFMNISQVVSEAIAQFQGSDIAVLLELRSVHVFDICSCLRCLIPVARAGLRIDI